jgi:hypothetical protein
LFERALTVLCLGSLAVLGCSSAAQAAPICNGTQSTAILCVEVDPTGLPTVNPTGSSFSDCIVILSGPCYPVTVPIPTVGPGSGPPPLDLDCRGDVGSLLFDDSVC